MANSEDIAWAAGLFEGEGSIVLRPAGGKRHGIQRRLRLLMTDADVVYRLCEVLEAGKVYGPLKPESPRHKPGFVWVCSRWLDIERILRAFLPYLKARRRGMAERMLLCAPKSRKKTHCVRGHPLTGPGSDVYEYDGWRQCRVCHRDGYVERISTRRSLVASGQEVALEYAIARCARGHPLEGHEADVYVYYGYRQCRRCNRLRKSGNADDVRTYAKRR